MGPQTVEPAPHADACAGIGVYHPDKTACNVPRNSVAPLVQSSKRLSQVSCSLSKRQFRQAIEVKETKFVSMTAARQSRSSPKGTRFSKGSGSSRRLKPSLQARQKDVSTAGQPSRARRRLAQVLSLSWTAAFHMAPMGSLTRHRRSRECPTTWNVTLPLKCPQSEVESVKQETDDEALEVHARAGDWDAQGAPGWSRGS